MDCDNWVDLPTPGGKVYRQYYKGAYHAGAAIVDRVGWDPNLGRNVPEPRCKYCGYQIPQLKLVCQHCGASQ